MLTAAASTQQAGGEKSCFWRVMWLLFFPLILLWHSIRIYFLPCLQVYADRLSCVHVHRRMRLRARAVFRALHPLNPKP